MMLYRLHLIPLCSLSKIEIFFEHTKIEYYVMQPESKIKKKIYCSPNASPVDVSLLIMIPRWSPPATCVRSPTCCTSLRSISSTVELAVFPRGVITTCSSSGGTDGLLAPNGAVRLLLPFCGRIGPLLLLLLLV